jgi:hypothetical protein
LIFCAFTLPQLDFSGELAAASAFSIKAPAAVAVQDSTSGRACACGKSRPVPFLVQPSRAFPELDNSPIRINRLKLGIEAPMTLSMDNRNMAVLLLDDPFLAGLA